MRRFWPILLVLAIALAACALRVSLGSAGRSYEEDHETLSRGCGIWQNADLSSMYNRYFLAWAPHGSEIIFEYSHSTSISTVNAEGASVRTLVSAYDRGSLPYGFYAEVSPDGTRIVYSTCEFHSGERDDDYDIAVFDLRSGRQKRLTTKSFLDHYPAWSPDGSRIAFVGKPHDYGVVRGAWLYMMAADGSDMQTLVAVVSPLRRPPIVAIPKGAAVLEASGIALFPPVWSPDGEKLAFLVFEGLGFPYRKSLYTVRLDGTELTRIAENVVSIPSWSPDGQRLAVAKYTRKEGEGEALFKLVAKEEVALFTLAADGSSPRLLTTVTDRITLLERNSHYQSKIHTMSWSPDGSQILYTCEFGACIVDVEDRRVTGLVKELPRSSFHYVAAWSPDGTRIALYLPAPPQLFTVARDGTDRRDLIRLDANGNVVPANPQQE